MSIDYGVHPVDPDHPGFCDWLSSEGVEIPREKGRFPTLAELLEVLQTFADLAVNIDEMGGTLVSLGESDQPGFALMHGEISADGTYHFSFSGSQNQDQTMAEILKRLSLRCGPFILREQFGATPLLIRPDTDLESALLDWHRRFKAKYPGSIS
ncbi:MAG: hypothetical protein JW987_05140 [Anaerolineaceae bacterium]|nr:hypothetical protein [Anaerolineaceae bacterium]